MKTLLALLLGCLTLSAADLAWDAVSGADYYNVYNATNAGPFRLLGSVTNTTLPDITLIRGTNFFYVTAVAVSTNQDGSVFSAESEQPYVLRVRVTAAVTRQRLQ